MVPVHIGIIPDGNRRFGKKYNLSLTEAYERGINKLKEVMEWSKEIGIKILTVWSFSTENINRNFFEKRIFFSLLKKKAEEALNSDEFEKNEIRCRFIGKLSLLPSSLTKILKKIEEKTEKYKKFNLNVAIGYGGRQEIVDACNKIIKSGIKRVNINNLRKFLYTDGIPDPDLIIRTSGEYRLSGFLPWQTVYSELIFLKPLWPELTKEDFINAIKEFENRERRFGR